MSNINWLSIQPGAILYLVDASGYRNLSKKNYVYAPSLPDYVVVDAVHCTENGWQIDFAGFPYKKGAILQDCDDDEYFVHLGTIDEISWDLDDVRENPYMFSNFYKEGGHIRDSNKTVLYVDDLLTGMRNFNIEKQGNKEELSRLFTVYNETGKLLPSQMAYVINRLTKGLYTAFLLHFDGDVEEAHKALVTQLEDKASNMDTLLK